MRSRNADAMAASNRGMALSGIRWRSRNCFTTNRMRWCTTSSATINSGSATRKRTCTSRSSKKGTAALPPSACPSRAESTKSGSQANSESTRMRWRTSISASSARCARRSNWKSGPPRTSEKSCGSRSSLSPDTGVEDVMCGLHHEARRRAEPADGRGPPYTRWPRADRCRRIADRLSYLKSASLNCNLKPRTRGSISNWRLHCTGGRVPGGAPVGRASILMLAGAERDLEAAVRAAGWRRGPRRGSRGPGSGRGRSSSGSR